MVVNTDIWSTTPADDVRMNRMTNISNTGTFLSTVDKAKHGILICTSTGSGLIKDHVYLCDADAESLIDLSITAEHNHSSNADGGDIVGIFAENSKFMDLCLTRSNDLMKDQWNQAVTSTGSILSDTAGDGRRSIKLLTGATSGATATVHYPHLKMDFSRRAFFQTKVRIETATSIAVHSGVNADSLSASDSNTVKFNAEVCTAVNNNWFLRSANGTANSASDSGEVMSTSTIGITINHFPELGTPEVNMYFDTAPTSIFQKTSHVPVSGPTENENLIKHTVKNSTAANRNYFVYGSRLAYYVDEQWA